MRAPILIAVVLAVLSIAPVAAQTVCGPRAGIVQQLQSQYGETRQAMGLQGQPPNTVVIEIWANLETGTWTVLMTPPGQPTCLVTSGQGWVADGIPAPKGTAL